MKSPTPTKLTLRLDAALIERAKTYALEQDRSLSRLVADYFAHLTVKHRTPARAERQDTAKQPAFGPITTSLRGALRQDRGAAAKAPKSREDYRAHLEDKYR